MRSAILAAAVFAVEPHRLSAQPPATEVGAVSAQQELQQFADDLAKRATPLQERKKVARRLVTRDTRESDQILLNVLRDMGNRDGQMAVADALSFDTTPNPDFIEPLANLLGDSILTGPAAQALAVFKDDDRARLRLTQFVNNRREPQAVRIAAIEAMGKLVDKRAAGTLIELLNREDEDGRIRNAAMSALGEMTGLSTNGRDIQQWTLWWQANANKSELEWARDLLNRNVDRGADLQRRVLALRSQTFKFIRDEYIDTKLPDADRQARIQTYLQSPSEDLRYAAADVIWNQVVGRLPGAVRPTLPVMQVLRVMVGDTSTEVRSLVAQIMGRVNDKDSVDALLKQLALEKDPEVRSAIIKAIGVSQDQRTILVILDELAHSEIAGVAQAAAEALKVKGLILRQKENADLADQAAQILRDRLKGTAGKAPLAPLRESLVEAMAELGHPSFPPVFYELARDGAVRVRLAAVKGLGVVGNPDSANFLAGVVDRDPDAGVRLEAVKALGKTASFAHADRLYRRLTPAERDPSVQEAAWQVLAGKETDTSSALFNKASIKELLQWAEYFKHNPTPTDLERRAIIFRFAERKLLENPSSIDQTTLAVVRQNLGVTLLQLDKPEEAAIKRAEEAAIKLGEALDYMIAQKAQPATIDLLVQETAGAMLRARKYTDSAEFMKREITAGRIDAHVLWIYKIRNEIARLQDNNDLKNADALIQAIKSVPLDPLSKERLAKLEQDVQKRLNSGGRVWSPHILADQPVFRFIPLAG